MPAYAFQIRRAHTDGRDRSAARRLLQHGMRQPRTSRLPIGPLWPPRLPRAAVVCLMHLRVFRWPSKNAGGRSHAPADTRHPQRPVLSWVARLRPARAARKRPPHIYRSHHRLSARLERVRHSQNKRAKAISFVLRAMSTDGRGHHWLRVYGAVGRTLSGEHTLQSECTWRCTAAVDCFGQSARALVC